MPKYNQHYRMAGAALLSALLAAGCNSKSQHNTGDTDPEPRSTETALTGTATLGPITGAAFTLYLIAGDGGNVEPGQPGTETATGFEFSVAPAQPFRVCASGGTYPDEATGVTLTNKLEDFCASVVGGTSVVNITPLTAFADQLMRGDILSTHAVVAEAITAANKKVQTFFGFNKALEQIEPFFGAPDSASDPQYDRYRMGLLLAAYSQLGARNQNHCQDTGQARLQALLQDIRDSVFDGRTLNDANPATTVAIEIACENGTTEMLPIGTGTEELLKSLDEFGLTELGQTMQVGAQTELREDIRTTVVTGDLSPVQVKVLPSQGLIAVDSATNLAYVPVYTFDVSNNARIAVVNLDPKANNPIMTTVSLPGSIQPIASSLDTVNHLLYVEARRIDSGVNVYVIDPATNKLLYTIDAVGVTHSGSFGGIIANPGKNKVLVIGTDDLGILDISTMPPTFLENSVIPLYGTDSVALNLETELLFNSSDGSNQLVDTSVNPPQVRSFSSVYGTTDGVAFDSLTNIVALDPEFRDQTTIFNFSELDLESGIAPNITVPGLGYTTPTGEGPGGQAAINVLSHQAVIADEFGHNLKLIQLPTTIITGTPNNNGQPGKATVADSNSAYQIAATVLPKADLSGEGGSAQTQLGLRGDPNSLSIDPVRNYAYALADNFASYNGWPINATNRPLFLVQIDLSAPVPGASPTAVDAQGNPLRWEPASRLIRLP